MSWKRATKDCLIGTVVGDKKTDLLFLSDVHFDSPKCDRRLFFSLLQQAKEREAHVFIIGDFFDLMGGKYDPRRSKKLIRPEYNSDNYLDLVINDAAERLAPFSSVLRMISNGNHETSVRRNLETDVLERLVSKLNDRGGDCFTGGYGGYIWIKHDNSHNKVRSVRIFFYHGKWGGVVSKGTQTAARLSPIVPDADIVVTGHTHDSWLMHIPRYHLDKTGTVSIKEQLHLKTGTFKEEFTEMDGWAVEKIGIPKSHNHWWITLDRWDNELKFTCAPTLQM